MDEIYQEIGRPAWWFTAVIAALLMNVLAAYTWVDTQRAKWSASRRLKLTEEERRRKERVKEMSGDVEKLHFAAHSESRERLEGIWWMMVSVLLMVGLVGVTLEHPSNSDNIDIFAGIGFVVAAILSLNHMFKAGKIRQEIADARVSEEEMRKRPTS